MDKLNSQSDLYSYYRNNTGRLIHKWEHYFDIYERHFSRFRDKSPVIVEIGVFQGGSLQMWKDYFGKGAQIYGVDINPACAQFEEEGIEIIIGSQGDRKFLRSLKERIPRIDILIDDGGHKMHQQIRTFEELYDHINEDGVYLCEDVHSSYRLFAGGGYKRRGTYIEYTKGLIDYLNAFNPGDKRLKANDFTRSTDSIHYYTSVVVIEKAFRVQPTEQGIGQPAIFPEKPPINRALIERIRFKAWKGINIILNFLRLPSI